MKLGVALVTRPPAPLRGRSWASGVLGRKRRSRQVRLTAIVRTAVLLASLCLYGNARPAAAAREPVQVAQAPDVMEMAKKALGLGQETQEGSESTGIANGVPFLVQFRDTVGDLEAGAQVLFRGMPMGTVKEVRITFGAADAHFDIPVTIELDPRPLVWRGSRRRRTRQKCTRQSERWCAPAYEPNSPRPTCFRAVLRWHSRCVPTLRPFSLSARTRTCPKSPRRACLSSR